ncbi:MAG: FtsX-like permease family protein, partial [Planctomycetota bacterium]
LLNRDFGEDVVPAIGDKQMIVWLLGKKIGDELEYIDQRGQKFRILLVAGLNNSILQGSLVISESQFIKRFPSETGYRAFLIDTPQERTEQTAKQLSAGLIDFGLELTDTTKRLAAFNAIEHTYLSIFQLLGGLGMMLGSIGLGLVVLRNMLDRRGELAMLRALGFNMQSIKQMVIYEHSGLMLFGLTSGSNVGCTKKRITRPEV